MNEPLEQLEQQAGAEVRDRAEHQLAGHPLLTGDATPPSQRHVLRAAAAVLVLAVGGGALAWQLRTDDSVVVTDGSGPAHAPTPATIPDGTPCSDAEVATGQRWPLDESGELIEREPIEYSPAERAMVIGAFHSSSDPALASMTEQPLSEGENNPASESEQAANLSLVTPQTGDPDKPGRQLISVYPTVGTLCETAASLTTDGSDWDTELIYQDGMVVGDLNRPNLGIHIIVGPKYAVHQSYDPGLDIPPYGERSTSETTREVDRIAGVINGTAEESETASPAATDNSEAATLANKPTIAIANATGRSGVAGKVADKLKAAGYSDVDSMNGDAGQPSKVFFNPGSEADAKAVAKIVGLPDAAVEERPSQINIEADAKDAQVVVVLGEGV